MSIVNVAMSSAINFSVDDYKYSDTQEHVQAVVGEIIVIVHQIISRTMMGKDDEKSRHDFSCLKGGLSTSFCEKFLIRSELLDNGKQFQLAHAICTLPLDISERDSAIAYDLIKRLLSIMLKGSSMVVDSKNLPSDDIMHRVRLIIEFVPLNQEDLITLLWQVQRTCGRTKTSREAWLAFLSKLLRTSQNEEDLWMTVGSYLS